MNRLPFKLLYRSYRLSSGLWHWASRRFTTAGLAGAGGVVAAGILGPDTENNVSYQAFPLLVSLLVLAMCFGKGFRGRFELKRVLPRVGTAGSALSYTVSV